ncbi:hypothetical protein [Pontibacter beigongshangensis]|uniref:hypothetical protein n=1 Tax=Pontibacter beigongshangensis TaxID=2574733 RepID=UPI00164F7573|nr:hypothetical protein [Pontibacter beigongshangensis]
MRNINKYYKIAFIGAALNLLLQLIVAFAIDPPLAAVFTPFYPVWVMLVVVGWRKEHPRR